MTYLTSHYTPPRTVLPKSDDKPTGMPCEADLAVLMAKAAQKELRNPNNRLGVKRPRPGGVPSTSQGQDAQARPNERLEKVITSLEANLLSNMKTITEGTGLSYNVVRDTFQSLRKKRELKVKSWHANGKRSAHYELGDGGVTIG